MGKKFREYMLGLLILAIFITFIMLSFLYWLARLPY
nr:MAG TPA: hypothetical protein [Caudoviricetes sp.]